MTIPQRIEREAIDRSSLQSSTDGSAKKKRKSLKELQMESPSGFKYFESKVHLETLDEETALQLWEDIFKPLLSFDLLSITKEN